MKRVLSIILVLLCLPFSSFADGLYSYHYHENTVVETGIRLYQDFGLAAKLNEDIIAWLYQEDTGINHPVMRGTKKDIYAKSTFKQNKKQTYGCAYLPYEASEDFSKGQLVIYGRISQEGPLGNINHYKKQAYYEEHPYYRLLTANGDYQLDIFAYLKSTALTNADFEMPSEESDFSAWYEKVTAKSPIVAPDDKKPVLGDRIAVISNASSGKRSVLLAVVKPVVYDTERSANIAKMVLDSTESQGKVVTAGPLGKQYVYFQRDPIWADLRFEAELTSRYRKLSGGACGPFALANIIINMVGIEKLPDLMKDANNGIGTLFCSCSVNQLYCSKKHLPYYPETAEEYARYLPLIICDYCAGNNIYGITGRHSVGKGGTQSIYVPYVCNALGLQATVINTLAEGLELLQERGNRGALFCSALDSSAFSFPGGSHFVAIIGVADGYAYVLDSISRDKYNSKYNIVTLVQPGVGRFQVSEMKGASLCPQYYIEPRDASVAPTDFTCYNPGQTLQ